MQMLFSLFLIVAGLILFFKVAALLSRLVFGILIRIAAVLLVLWGVGLLLPLLGIW